MKRKIISTEILFAAIILLAIIVLFVLIPALKGGGTATPGDVERLSDKEDDTSDETGGGELSSSSADSEPSVPPPEPTAKGVRWTADMMPTPSPAPMDGYLYSEVADWTDEQLEPYLSQVEVPAEFISAMSEVLVPDYTDRWFWQKAYLSSRPEISIQGFGNPYYEDETYLEGAGQLSEILGAVYHNSQVRVSYDESSYITVGVDNVETDGICLNAYSSVSEQGRNIGFMYMSSADNGNLSFIISTSPERPPISSANQYHNYIVTEQTYDSSIPSITSGTVDSGVIWKGMSDDTVYLRVVDMDSGAILGVFNIVITEADDLSFSIQSVESNESERGQDISDSIFDQITRDAISRFFRISVENDGEDAGNTNGRYYGTMSAADVEGITNNAIVEMLPKAFFPVLLSLEDNDPLYRSTLTGNLCAVHFNVDNAGYYTVYYHIYRIIEHEDGTQDFGFSAVAYDVPNPYTESIYDQLVQWPSNGVSTNT